jgi:hypothetical protein
MPGKGSIMPHSRVIDYSYRPADYWDHPNPVAAILSRIKGQERRKLVRRELLAAEAEELPEEIFAEEDHQLEALAGPAWMGGEYLPAYLPGEVEIARIVLASVTQDVYSIRARRRSRRICYRIVNEYQMDMRLGRQSSKKPLTLLALTQAIDAISVDGEADPDFIDGIRDFQTEDPVAAVDFISVESDLYPGLEQHYHAKALAWLARQSMRNLEA